MSQTRGGQADAATTGGGLPAADEDTKKAPTGWTPVEEGAGGSAPGQRVHHTGQNGPGQGRPRQRVQGVLTSRGLPVQTFDSEMPGNESAAAGPVLLQPAVRSDAWP
jgi:hypothetical protein